MIGHPEYKVLTKNVFQEIELEYTEYLMASKK